jgi:hypothetical protein
VSPLPAGFAALRFPPQEDRGSGQEILEVELADGRVERMRIHEYARVYAVPGLYEEVVQRRLQCLAPATVAGLLASGADALGWSRGDVRVLDLGAGNGVSGEALRACGLSPVAAVDILPEARDAALRDRPGLYAAYLAADLLALSEDEARALRELRPNAISVVGAVGVGHLPAAALAAALELVEGDALLAYGMEPNLDAPASPEEREVADLLEGLRRAGRLRELRRESYRHRLTAAGGERRAEAGVVHITAGER